MRYARFEFVGGQSRKFWEVSVLGDIVLIRWGRIGTGGQTQNKYFGTETAASQFARTKCQEKEAKGYVLVDGEVDFGRRPAAPRMRAAADPPRMRPKAGQAPEPRKQKKSDDIPIILGAKRRIRLQEEDEQ